jgi:HK97 gp10 family phage protein
MSFFLKIYPTEKTERVWDNQGPKMMKGIEKGVRKGMKFLKEESKKFDGVNVPRIRTGNLRDSIDYTIKVRGDEIEAFLGADAEYAAIQEFGGISGRGHSSPIPPRPFLSTSVKKNKDEFKDIILKEINSSMKQAILGKIMGIFK